MRFYYLKPDINHTYFSDVSTSRIGSASLCPACARPLGASTSPGPVRVELELCADTYGDIAFGPGADLLISERFRDSFEANQLTGLFGFNAVHIVRSVLRKKQAAAGLPPIYYRVFVSQSQTVIDQEASEFEWEEPVRCAECLLGTIIQRWKRVIIRPESWSGEDVFFARGMAGAVFASQRFKEFCSLHAFTNTTLIPAEHYEYDFYPWRNVKRAQELANLPIGRDLLQKTKPNGEVWRYCVPTNELVIINTNGTIKSLFRPLGKLTYWNAQ